MVNTYCRNARKKMTKGNAASEKRMDSQRRFKRAAKDNIKELLALEIIV